MERFLFIFEMIGTVAFAASGAILGIRKGMDIFGVCILGLTTACGGGMVRDVLLGTCSCCGWTARALEFSRSWASGWCGAV